MAGKIPVVEVIKRHPGEMNPTNAVQYIDRGWAYLNEDQPDKAIDDLKHELDMEAENADAYYVMGLALKKLNKHEAAIEAFQHVMQLAEAYPDHSSKQMLKRLTNGQINQLQTGDWNLEKEIWQRK